MLEKTALRHKEAALVKAADASMESSRQRAVVAAEAGVALLSPCCQKSLALSKPAC